MWRPSVVSSRYSADTDWLLSTNDHESKVRAALEDGPTIRADELAVPPDQRWGSADVARLGLGLSGVAVRRACGAIRPDGPRSVFAGHAPTYARAPGM